MFLIISPLAAKPAKASVGVICTLNGNPIQLTPLLMVTGWSAGLMGMPSSWISQLPETLIAYIWATSIVLRLPLQAVPVNVVDWLFFALMMVPLPAVVRAARKGLPRV